MFRNGAWRLASPRQRKLCDAPPGVVVQRLLPHCRAASSLFRQVCGSAPGETEFTGYN
ncbi:Uncharacterised protein [Acinetobacter baumannii]|jgi:hypothetical protein|nr:Uncharacterised protein [Acinetobacter baumannii]